MLWPCIDDTIIILWKTAAFLIGRVSALEYIKSKANVYGFNYLFDADETRANVNRISDSITGAFYTKVIM